MSQVYIAGVGMTPLGKFPDLSVKQLTRNAVDSALLDAGLELGDIQGAWFSNSRQGQMEGQNSIRGQCALRSMGFETIPIVNVENACCSSSTGLNQAFAAIKAGLIDIGLVVGTEKMFYPEKKELMLQAFRGGWDVHDEANTERVMLALGDSVQVPEEAQKDTGARSVFMDIYASLARQHMRLYGTTQSQIAAAAAKNHWHSTKNPMAQYQMDMSVDQVLADRLISWPLTRAMCAPLSDGSGALVICSKRALKRVDRGRSIKVLASALVSGSNRDPDDLSHHLGRIAANRAYEQAGLGPEDVDVAEVHDATSFAEILQIENLGLCEPGGGGRITELGETRLGGRVPVNPSGGLVSKGHPIGATGAIQLFELVTQLRGEAGERQVPEAQVAVAENGGGFYGAEDAAAVVTVLGRN
ncbi:MAG: thiolase family protein [Qingshengfaniella sp.]